MEKGGQRGGGGLGEIVDDYCCRGHATGGPRSLTCDAVDQSPIVQPIEDNQTESSCRLYATRGDFSACLPKQEQHKGKHVLVEPSPALNHPVSCVAGLPYQRRAENRYRYTSRYHKIG